MSRARRNRAATIGSPITDSTAAQITNLRLEESTKNNYRGKVRRIVMFLNEKNPNAVTSDGLLKLPMEKCKYLRYDKNWQ